MVGKIRLLRNEHCCYTGHGLTMPKLAAILNKKEYRVRRVINGSGEPYQTLKDNWTISRNSWPLSTK